MKMEWPVEEAQQDTVTGEESRSFVMHGADGNVVGLPHIARSRRPLVVRGVCLDRSSAAGLYEHRD